MESVTILAICVGALTVSFMWAYWHFATQDYFAHAMLDSLTDAILVSFKDESEREVFRDTMEITMLSMRDECLISNEKFKSFMILMDAKMLEAKENRKIIDWKVD